VFTLFVTLFEDIVVNTYSNIFDLRKFTNILIWITISGLFLISCAQEEIRTIEPPVIAKNLGNGSIRYEQSREEIIRILTINVADTLKSVLAHPDELTIRPMDDNHFYLIARAASEKENKVVNFAMELYQDPGGAMFLTGVSHTCSGIFCSSCAFDFSINESGKVVISGCHCSHGWGFCNHTVSTDPPRFQ
jgi:hypothetical protein